MTMTRQLLEIEVLLGRIASLEAQVASLAEHEKAVLAFAQVEDVPFTNNQAERETCAQPKSSVTKHGTAVYARSQTVLSTCCKQGCDVFVTLRNLFAHQPVSLLAGGWAVTKKGSVLCLVIGI